MNRRELLLEKAEQLFAENGYEGTSVRMLAKEAGLNLAMISYYFGSKEKLFEALVEERTRITRERMVDLQARFTDPEKRLEELVRLYVDRLLGQPRFNRILFREVTLQCRPGLQANITELLMRNVSEMRRILQDGVEQGRFREVDIDLTIVTFIGTITQLITSSPQMHQRMLGQKVGDDLSGLLSLRERVVVHLISLLKQHLLIPSAHGNS